MGLKQPGYFRQHYSRILTASDMACFVLDVTLHFKSQLERAALARPWFGICGLSMARKDLYKTNKAALRCQQVGLYMV